MSQQRTHRRVTLNPAGVITTAAPDENIPTVPDQENIYFTGDYEDDDGYDRV